MGDAALRVSGGRGTEDSARPEEAREMADYISPRPGFCASPADDSGSGPDEASG
jgi:hypothetical protein